MYQSEHPNTVPKKLHGAALSDYAVERIDEGLEAASHISIEASLGHAVLTGVMTAQEAYDCLIAYEKAFLPDSDNA